MIGLAISVVSILFIKRHKLTKWIGKQDPSIFCIQKRHINVQGQYYPRINGWKKILQADGPKKQAGIAILIFDKVDFKPKLTKRDREEHYTTYSSKEKSAKTTL